MGHVETEVLRPGCRRWAAAQGWGALGVHGGLYWAACRLWGRGG